MIQSAQEQLKRRLYDPTIGPYEQVHESKQDEQGRPRATLNIYAKRNELLGRRVQYDLGAYNASRRSKVARETADALPIEDRSGGTVVGVWDFDYPYLVRLDDGRTIRTALMSAWTVEEA